MGGLTLADLFAGSGTTGLSALAEGLRFVGSIGVVALAGSTVYGIVTLVISMLAIGHVSGVPVRSGSL